MTIPLVNSSHVSFGASVITPRWLYVLAAATPERYGVPLLTDETREPIEPDSVRPGDVVGVGIHRGNALRGHQVGHLARERSATVVFGGIHASLFPDEPREHGGARAVVRGDGDRVWANVLDDLAGGRLEPFYDGGKLDPDEFLPARWDLQPANRYMWASVQTVRGCPKDCSFCSVRRIEGQRPCQRSAEVVLQEIAHLRYRRFRYITLADDNFYPVTLLDLDAAARRADPARLHALKALRGDRFWLLGRLARLPEDTIFFTQITLEATEDPEFLDAMRRAHIIGALVGVESVTTHGLKDGYKPFNLTGEALVDRLRTFRRHGTHPGFVHLWPPERPAEHVRRHRAACGGSGPDVRAVRPADAFSRHDRFRGLGGEGGC